MTPGACTNEPGCLARQPLCHQVNLPRCEARRRHFIMTCDIFVTGQTNILALLFIRKKLINQPTVALLKSLKSTHSTKLLKKLYCTHIPLEAVMIPLKRVRGVL